MKNEFQGHYGSLVELSLATHGEGLWAVLKNSPATWDYMGYGDFVSQDEFNAFIKTIEQSVDPFYYAVLNKQNEPVGWMTLMEHRAAHKVIEVGNIVFSTRLQRTPLATETIYMLGKYVFETLGYRRFEWKCNNNNEPSKRAAARFGFSYEGLFRQHMIIKGQNRDTAWYSMLDSEWAARKAAFEKWLEARNFDKNGQQINQLTPHPSTSLTPSPTRGEGTTT